MMNWDDLRFFVDVARSGSLSATARALRVDHSTVARRVASLETSLGIRLFDRLPQGYILTPEGERLNEQARRLEDDILALERMADGGRSELSGTVRVSGPPAFSSHFLVPRLAVLRDRHPDIALELHGSNASVSLTRREADVAIRLVKPEATSLVMRKLGSIGFGVFASRSYAAGRSMSEMAFMGYEESMDHVPQQAWLKQVSHGRPLVFRTNDLAGLFSAVKAGLGAAALPFFMTAGDADLICLCREGAPTRDIWLLAHEDVRRSPRVRAVMDILAEIVQRERGMLQAGGEIASV